jgi:hypothetical protein
MSYAVPSRPSEAPAAPAPSIQKQKEQVKAQEASKMSMAADPRMSTATSGGGWMDESNETVTGLLQTAKSRANSVLSDDDEEEWD